MHIASSVFYRKPIQQGAWFLVDKKSQICLCKLCSIAAGCVTNSVSISLRAKRMVCAFMLESPVLEAGFQRFLTDKQQLLSSGMVIRPSVRVFKQNASQGTTHYMDIYAGDDKYERRSGMSESHWRNNKAQHSDKNSRGQPPDRSQPGDHLPRNQGGKLPEAVAALTTPSRLAAMRN